MRTRDGEIRSQGRPHWIRLILEVPQQNWAGSLAFWTAATGWHLSATGAYRVDLEPVSGAGWIVLQSSRAKAPHLHLELECTAGEAALRSGQPLEVLRSPGGMAFCYTDSRSPRRFDRSRLDHVLDQVCLDIPSPLWPAEVAFWEAVIGRQAQTKGRPEFARLFDPDPHGSPRILLQRLDTSHGHVQAHLDFAVADRRSEKARHLALGAQEIRVMQRWTVMLAPDGTTYCLTDRDPVSGRAA